MTQLEPVIGLEIHIQLKTASKMFCSCPNQTENLAPNTNICPVCSGQTGSLPVANREALEKAIIMGLALNCQIAEYSKFDRKNYFYPDLPKGYQISQFDRPICGKGEVEMKAGVLQHDLSRHPAGDTLSSKAESNSVGGFSHSIRITRAHLEEDAGKLIHPAGSDYSLVDLNRAGVPLLEIVTEPDFKNPAQAKAFLQYLRTLARYTGASDADMEKGHLRCDANISMRPVGAVDLPGYKVEVKNMNSFKAVEEALAYEIDRQSGELAEGKKMLTETRGWSDAKKITVAQRTKEGSDDYRYFPEPDLPVFHFTKEDVHNLSLRVPELPAVKRERFMKEFSLPPKQAIQLVEDKSLAGYFEEVVSELEEWCSVEKITDPAKVNEYIKEAANWCVGLFTELLKTGGKTAEESKINPENFAELIKMIGKGEVSRTAAKEVFAVMFETGDDPSVIVADKGLKQVSDTVIIEAAFNKAYIEIPKAIEDYKAGKHQAIGSVIGYIMKETKGKANPKVVNEILKKKLG